MPHRYTAKHAASEQYAPKHVSTEQVRLAARKTTILAIGAGAVIGTCLGAAFADNFSSALNKHTSATIGTCNAPTAEDLSNTENALFRPFQEQEGNLNLADYRYIDPEIAARHGLTFHDNSKEFTKLSRNGKLPNELLSPSAYFEVAQVVVAKYNISLTLPQSNVEGVTQEIHLDRLNAVAADNFRYGVTGLIQGLSSVPVELIEESNLETIRLVSFDSDYDGTADVISQKDISIDILEPVDISRVFTHELFHLLDRAQCESPEAQFIDTPFSANNPPSYQYIGADNYRAQKIPDRFISLEHKPLSVTNLQDVTAANNYGFVNVGEDKAAIGESLLEPSEYDEMFNPSTPVLRKKALFLEARLWKSNPELVNYFGAIAAANQMSVVE